MRLRMQEKATENENQNKPKTTQQRKSANQINAHILNV